MQAWQCIQSFQVPQFVKYQDGQFLPTDDSDGAQPLFSTRYINNGTTYLILKYQKIIGVLKVQDANRQYLDLVDNFTRCFRPILTIDSFRKSRINVSDNQQYIAVDFLRVNNLNLYR